MFLRIAAESTDMQSSFSVTSPHRDVETQDTSATDVTSRVFDAADVARTQRRESASVTDDSSHAVGYVTADALLCLYRTLRNIITDRHAFVHVSSSCG